MSTFWYSRGKIGHVPKKMKAFMLKVRMPASRRHIYLNFYHQKFLAHLSRRLKGELIVYCSIRRPCVRALVRPSVRLWVNIFKLKYLCNQWANRNQILSEASLGWGFDCIRFWTR